MKHHHTLLKEHIHKMNSYSIHQDHHLAIFNTAVEVKHDLNSKSSILFHIAQCLKTLSEYDPELLGRMQSPLH